MTDQPEIYARMAAVMAAVGAVGKNQRAQGGGMNYAFRGIDDVMLALNPALIANQVVIAPEVLERETCSIPRKSGGNQQHTVLKVRFRFYAPDGSYLDVVTYGESSDFSDKSVNKAMAGALKYAITQTFCIPTDEPKDSELAHHDTSESTIGRPKKMSANSLPESAKGVAAALGRAMKTDYREIEGLIERATSRKILDNIYRERIEHLVGGPDKERLIELCKKQTAEIAT